MKLFKKLFKKKQPVEAAAPVKPIIGVPYKDYTETLNGLVDEFAKARSRQKSLDAKPSSYMKGLQFAIDLVRQHAPYKLNTDEEK